MTVLVLHTFKEAPDPFPDPFIKAQEDWLLRTPSGCPTVKVSATRAQAYRNIERCTIRQRRCHLTACFLLSIIYNLDNAVGHYDLAWQHPIWCVCIENAFDLMLMFSCALPIKLKYIVGYRSVTVEVIGSVTVVADAIFTKPDTGFQ